MMLNTNQGHGVVFTEVCWGMACARGVRSFIRNAFDEVNFIVTSSTGVHCFAITFWHKIFFLIFSVASTAFLSIKIVSYSTERIYLRRTGSTVSLLQQTNFDLRRKFDFIHLNLLEISRYFEALGCVSADHEATHFAHTKYHNNYESQSLGFDAIMSRSRNVDAALDILVKVRKQMHYRLDNLSRMIATTGVKLSAVEKAKNVSKSSKGVLRAFDAQHSNYQDPFDAYEAISDFTMLGVEVENMIKLERLTHSLPMRSPLQQYRITSHFGHRKDPFKHTLALHRGLDMQGDSHAVVVATGAGKVVFSGPATGYGNMVDIDHGHGITTRYAHLEAVLVHVGDAVTPGFPLGYQGATGRACGEHLHYEVRYRGTPFNPHKFIFSSSYVKNLKFAQAQ